MAKRIEIPDFVIDDQKKAEVIERINQQVRIMAAAYDRLKNMQDIGVVPEDPHEINMTEVDRLVDAKKEACYSLETLTTEGRKRAAEEWEKVRINAQQNVRIIQEFYEEFPEVELDFRFSPVKCVNVEELAERESRIMTPKHVPQHFLLISNVKDAIAKLKEFEADHGWCADINTSMAAANSPTTLIWTWLNVERNNKIKEEMERKQRERQMNMTAVLRQRAEEEELKAEQYARMHPEEVAKQQEEQEKYDAAMKQMLEGTTPVNQMK